MFTKQRRPLRLRVISSRIGSLLLLFQRSPLVQMLFPEVRIIGGSALAEMTKWSVATVAGLGVFDSVAGATTLTQVSPVAGSYTVPATVGTNLSFVFQCVGAPGKPASWQVIGALPTGLVHANATNSTTDAIQGIPAQSGSFLVTIKAWEKANYSGKSYAKNFTISVTGPPPSGTPPVITSQPGSVTINSGGTATLTVVASGSPAPTFQWYVGSSGVISSPISGATSATYTTPSLTSNASYWARATNASGSANSNAATVSVRIPPAITSGPTSTTIHSGSTATFTVITSGTSPTYQWYKGTTGVITNPISGATSASYTTPLLSADASYWVRATNAAGTADSRTVTASVITPPAITSAPVSTTIHSGAAATFTVAVSGTAPSFQWYQGASGVTTSPISGATGATYTTPALTANSSYWARINNSAGHADSATVTATIIIDPVVTPPTIVSAPVSTTINSGATATFTAAASGTSPSFQWYQGASGVTTSPISGATSASYTTPLLTADASYWVRAANAAGTADSGTVTASVITPPAITSGPTSTTIHSGSTATFTVIASGTSPTYQWYKGTTGVITNPISGATSATYTTPALTANSIYWVRISNSAGHADSAAATASMAIIEYVLSATGTNGIITGGGTYQAGSSVTITATPNAGYVFTGWTGDASGTTNPLTFVMTANKAIGATFTALAADSDGDGLSDIEEATVTGTDPNRADTDGDGILDGIEVNVSHINPLLADSNADGFSDVYAFCVAGDPFNPTVGNEITFDLGKLATTGMSLKVSGKLPSGLRFNQTTKVLTGIVSGNPGIYQVKLQVLKGSLVLANCTLPITVLPFPSSMMGDFETLLEDSNSMPAGICRLSIKSAGQWSATLESAGFAKQSAKGTFSVAPRATTVAIHANFRASKTSPVTGVDVLISVSTPLVTGTYSSGTLRGFRLAGGAENPSQNARYNLVLDPERQDGVNVPGGIGWMKGSVSNRGYAKMTGLLGDGTKCGVSLRLSPSGQAILWAQPYKNKNSFIGGVITLANTGQSVNPDQMLVDDVWWFKDVQTSSKSYPNGFPAMPITVGSSKWVVPSTADGLGGSLGWRNNRTAALTLDGLDPVSPIANLSSGVGDPGKDVNSQDVSSLVNIALAPAAVVLPTELTMDNSFNLASSAPVAAGLLQWKGKVASRDGAVTGAFVIPDSTLTLSVAGKAVASGVLVLEERWGSVSGCGLIQVPISGAKGQFITTAFVLGK